MEDIKALLESPKPASYKLLRKYQTQAAVSSRAHKYAESYYRRFNKMLLIALMVFTTTGSVLISIESIDVDHIASKILAYLVMLISGIITIIKPAERFTQHNAVSSEFNDIATDIENLLAANGLSREDIRDANHVYLSKLQIWNGQSPPLAAVFVSRAKKSNHDTSDSRDKKNLTRV